jgi:hypothetical protein
MLEPTKEPLKPLSAAEKIASIGQTTTMTPEINTCTSDQFQVKSVIWISICLSTYGYICFIFLNLYPYFIFLKLDNGHDFDC